MRASLLWWPPALPQKVDGNLHLKFEIVFDLYGRVRILHNSEG